MHCKLPFWTLSFGLVLLLAPFALSAQQGTLVGTVTGRLDGRPVALADIRDALSGFNASGGVRFTRSFPASSADFRGTACITGGTGGLFEENCVDDFAIFDLSAGYAVPNTAATVQFSITNVLNTGYRSFPGVPYVGRLALLRVRYDLL